MSLPVPLVVNLSTTTMERAITVAVDNISFRKAVPGGFASCTLDLDRPLSAFSPEIGQYAKLKVSDGRHAGILWEGRLSDPGRANDTSGGRYKIAALGPSAFFGDQQRPRTWVMSDPSNWSRRTANTLGSAQFVVEPSSSFGSGGPVVRASIPETTNHATPPTTTFSQYYDLFGLTGQFVGSVRLSHISGNTDVNSDIILTVVAVSGIVDGVQTDGTVRSWNVRQGVDWASTDATQVWWTRGEAVIGVPPYTQREMWTLIGDVVIKPRYYNRLGTVFTSATTAYTTVTEIIEDILGDPDWLPYIDGVGALIDSSGTQIKEFGYPNGVTPGQALDDLMKLEGDHYWAAWETNSAGLHRFEWAAWPNTVRYEASVADGFDSPGSSAEVWDEVIVLFTSGGVRQKTGAATTTPAFAEFGISRCTLIDIGDATLAQAQAAGTAFIQENSKTRNGGTLRVSRPILDRSRGRLVQPYEIEPGSLIAVTDASPATLNTIGRTSRDAETIFRIVAVEYSSRDNTAELSLDEHVRTSTQRLANVGR